MLLCSWNYHTSSMNLSQTHGHMHACTAVRGLVCVLKIILMSAGNFSLCDCHPAWKVPKAQYESLENRGHQNLSQPTTSNSNVSGRWWRQSMDRHKSEPTDVIIVTTETYREKTVLYIWPKASKISLHCYRQKVWESTKKEKGRGKMKKKQCWGG